MEDEQCRRAGEPGYCDACERLVESPHSAARAHWCWQCCPACRRRRLREIAVPTRRPLRPPVRGQEGAER